MIGLILFIIFLFLIGSAWLFFKCKLETENLTEAFDLFSTRFLDILNPINIFKGANRFLSKLTQFISKKVKKEKEKDITEILDIEQAQELLRTAVSDQTIKSMGIDLRELHKLARVEQEFRTKVVKHIVNNRLIYREGGRLKMVVPLETMPFLHKNLSPLVNNKGEITISIKEEKCRIALDEIDDIEFREYIMANGLNEEIYNNKREREVALNTARMFFTKGGTQSSNTKAEGDQTSTTNEKQDTTASATATKNKEIKEDYSNTPNKENIITEHKEEYDPLSDILEPKAPIKNTPLSDAKEVLAEVLKDDNDYDVGIKAPKEKTSVTKMKSHLSLLQEFGDQDMENLLSEKANEVDSALQNSNIVAKKEHKIEVSEIDLSASLGAAKDEKVKGEAREASIDDDEMQQAFSQMASEESGGWGDESEENVFSIEDFRETSDTSSNNQNLSDNKQKTEEDDEEGEISKAWVNTKNDINRTVELVHNKPFGEADEIVMNIDFKKSFSMIFKKNADLRKALAINIVNTKPIIFNDNKQFLFIGDFQIGAALCKLFAPDEEKYYKLLEPMLKNPQNRPARDKFLIECKDTLNSLSRDGFGVLTNKNFETLNFIDAQGRFYFSYGWRVKPEVFQIAFEGILKADDVLSYARWLSEPLNDNISIAKNYSVAEKERTKPLFPKLDSSIFV